MWVKLDDGFADHPKIGGLTDRAFRVHVTALCYANRYQTEGVVSAGAQRHIRSTKAVAVELVRAGLWEHGTDAGVFAIHDYFDYQLSRDEVTDLREKRSEAGRIGGVRSGEARKQKAKQMLEKSQAKPKQNRTPYPVPEGSIRTRGTPTGLHRLDFSRLVGAAR